MSSCYRPQIRLTYGIFCPRCWCWPYMIRARWFYACCISKIQWPAESSDALMYGWFHFTRSIHRFRWSGHSQNEHDWQLFQFIRLSLVAHLLALSILQLAHHHHLKLRVVLFIFPGLWKTYRWLQCWNNFSCLHKLYTVCVSLASIWRLKALMPSAGGCYEMKQPTNVRR